MAQDFDRWLQSRLTSHGFSPGPIDGVIGKTTVGALRAFQRARRLPVTGQADAATVAALRATSSQNVTVPVDRDFNAPPSNLSPLGPWPRQADVEAFYGPVGTSQVKITVPWPMRLAWDKRRTISGITVHEKVAESAERALAEIWQAYGANGIAHIGADLFGGSLNVRRMRGGTRYSMHSWGVAIDFDPERNGLRVNRPNARLSAADCEPFWRAWERQGWVSLGRARDFDWMHVQAARL
jgi:peptidoglycan hydrolase-like protein with peptidoglycan-binding domain